MSPHLRKVQALTNMPPPKSKKELQSFLGTLNYFSKFSSKTTEVCELLQKPTSVKADLYDKAKKIIKQDTYMKCYDASKPLYLKTDTSGTSLGGGLLQVRESRNYEHDEMPDNVTLHQTLITSNSMSSAEWQYSNIKLEALWYVTQA